MKKITFFLLSLLLLVSSACQQEILNPQNQRKLVQETYFIDTKSNQTGFTNYSYDQAGKLLLQNYNDQILISYTYDSRDSLIQETLVRDGSYITETYHMYPSDLEKTSYRIRDNADTIYLQHFQYDGQRNLIYEDYYKTASKAFLNDKKLRKITESHYTYQGNGLPEEKLHKKYVWQLNTIKDSTTTRESYDDRGNLSFKSITGTDGSVLAEIEQINTYDGDLLIEKFQAGLESSSFERFEYDRKGRLKKTFDFEDFLLIEQFYGNNLLKERHSFSKAGTDPSIMEDKKYIIEYRYE